MAFMRKRVYAGKISRRPYKRTKRTFKRRRLFGRRRANQSAYSKNTGVNQTRQWRSRRLPKRVYRKKVWDQTFGKQVYKAISTDQQTDLSTPNNATQAALSMFSAFDLGFPFWTTGGGLQPISFGVAATSLTSRKYIIKGGEIGLTVTATNTVSNPIRVRIQLIYLKEQFLDTTGLNTSNTAAAYISATLATWPQPFINSVQNRPDYHEYFSKPYLDMERVLNNNEFFTVKHRVGLHVIDADEYVRGAGFCPFWIVYSSQVNNTPAGSETINIVRQSSLSFVEAD